MSEYIKGFDAGYDYVLTQIERHPNFTVRELLDYLRGATIEIGPSIPPAREKDKECD